MEGNKDEAERCIDYAQQAFNYGDRAKAEKFLKKAEKLYPTQKAKDLLTLLNKLEETNASTNSSSDDVRNRRGSSASTPSNFVNKHIKFLSIYNVIYTLKESPRKESSAGGDASSSSKSSGPEYTQEQLAAVKK